MACCAQSPLAQRINRWTIFGLTILSWILSVVTLASCTFLVVEDYGEGLFSYEMNSDGDCEKYDPDAEFNAADQVGRAFGILTNLLLVFAFVGTFLMIFVLKEKAARMVWTASHILFVLALLSLLITVAGVATEICIEEFFDVDCTIGAAGICNAINAIVLIGVVSTVFCTSIPDEPVIKCGGPPREGNQNNKLAEQPSVPAPAAPKITRTIENTPQGRKITEIVEHPDGTKTVTETFEEAEQVADGRGDP